MNRLHTYLILLLIAPAWAWSQASDGRYGYSEIRRAESCIERGKLNEAKRHLHNAENAEYGFCGNAWMTAHCHIKYNRYRIALQEAQWEVAYDMIENEFASCRELGLARDSLAIDLACRRFGTARVGAYLRKGLEQPMLDTYLGDEVFLIIPMDTLPALRIPVTDRGYTNPKGPSCNAWDLKCIREQYIPYLRRSAIFLRTQNP